MADEVTPGGTEHSQDAAVEVEWQFDAPDLERVAKWLSRRAVGTVRPLGTHSLEDVYLDSSDWRLRRANRSLRIRERVGQAEATLKSLEEQPEGPRTRSELTQQIPRPSIEALLATPGPVAASVKAVAGREPLIERGRVHTTRTDHEIATGRPQRPVATLSLDRTTFGDGEPMLRVEVEVLAGGDAADVVDFVARLERSCRLTQAEGSKFTQSLRRGGGVPAFDPPPPPPAPGATFGEVATAAIATQLHALDARTPAARLGEDVEGVHDVRVAIRRLRAALALLADAFDGDLDSVRTELSWLGGALGGTRDLDVLLEELERWESTGPPARSEALAPFHAILEADREAARRELLAALDSDRHEELLGRLRALLDDSAHAPAAAERGRTRGAAILRRAHRKFTADAALITLDAPDAAWHQLRIRGKRLRYALEFFVPTFGRPAERAVSTLKRVQDVLGEVQDASIASERLAEIAMRADIVPATAFALGEWAGVRATRAAQLRADFAELLAAFARDWQKLRSTFPAAARRGGG